MRTALKRPILLWLFLLIVWSIYRYFLHNSQYIDEFLVKPVVFLGAVFFIVKFVEKKGAASLGYKLSGIWENIFIGWGVGAFFVAEALLSKAVSYRGFIFLPIGISLTSFLVIVAMALATAISEETVFRGYLFTRLEQAFNNDLIANFISALLFAIIHLPIALLVMKYDVYSLLAYLLAIFVLGYANGFIFSKKRNIIAPIISYAVWNLAIALFR